MIHDEQTSGVPDARILQAARAEPQEALRARARDDDAELAELRRALLLYGTAGDPARGGGAALRG